MAHVKENELFTYFIADMFLKALIGGNFIIVRISFVIS
jgi:hypothetical protein